MALKGVYEAARVMEEQGDEPMSTPLSTKFFEEFIKPIAIQNGYERDFGFPLNEVYQIGNGIVMFFINGNVSTEDATYIAYPNGRVIRQIANDGYVHDDQLYV